MKHDILATTLLLNAMVVFALATAIVAAGQEGKQVTAPATESMEEG